MEQLTKKSAHAGNKKPRSAFAAMRNAEQQALDMGRESVENLMRGTDDFNRMAKECAGICSGNVAMLVETGSAASRAWREISDEILEGCNRAFSDCAGLSQEAFTCRTINDMINWQNKATRQLSEDYFNTANRLFGIMFDSWTDTLEPLNERTAIASGQIRKALAA